jgi:hypothetical protein
MYIGSEEKGNIDRRKRQAILPQALRRHEPRRAGTERRAHHGASGKLSGLAHPWLARMGNRIVDP